MKKYWGKWLVLFITVTAWLSFFGFLSSTSYFINMESQRQKILYNFKLTLPGTLKHNRISVYLVNIDDAFLPDSACRAPLDRRWLNMVLKAAKRQRVKTIGLNISLKGVDSSEDRSLLKTIEELDNVILLSGRSADYSDPFFQKAKGWGSRAFLVDSSRQVTSVCDDPLQCVCKDAKNCGLKIFHREILNNYSPNTFDFNGKLNKGWLKINFSAYKMNVFPRTIYSASEFVKLPPDTLPKNSILLIGKKLSEVNEFYKTPLTYFPGASLSGGEQYITSAELTAAALNMFLEKSFLFRPPRWMTAALLFGVLSLLSLTLSSNVRLSPTLACLAPIILWNLASVILFSYYSVELNVISNSMAILSFGLFCSWYKTILNRINFLELKNQLRKERIDSLVDKFHSHSVFNALEHIRYLILIRNPIVEEYLLSYASLLRKDLRRDSMKKYLVKDQWEYVKNYLNLQNMKRDNKIKLIFSVDDDLLNDDKSLIPWKLFFPLAENAFKYCEAALSVHYKERPVVKSVLFIKNNLLTFQVFNNFVGDYKAPGSGQGLSNLKRRLQILYPKNDWLLQSEQTDDIWTSTLTIPLKRG